MTHRDFCYWLQGYFEILDPENKSEAVTLTQPQLKCIREHLQLAFKHVPNASAPFQQQIFGGFDLSLAAVC